MPWTPVGEPRVGPPGTVDLATVTPLAAGATPTATVSGPPAARKLDLGIPVVPGGLTPAQQTIFDEMGTRLTTVENKPTTEYVETSYTGTTSIPVKDNGTYVLRSTSTQTVSFTGAANGSSIAIVADFPFRVSGTTYSAGLHVGLRLPTGWDILTIRGSVPNPVVSLTGTTQSTASVTWAAVPGATSYLARVNGSGSGTDIGNVTSWTAEGLPLGQTGNIGIRAVGPDGMSAWVTVPFTTSTPAASVLRMAISHPDSTSETGNATAGYNYVFNSTPYGEGLTSNFWRLPANGNGFVQGVVTASTAGGFGLHFSDGGQSPHGGAIPSTVGISVPVINGSNTYTPAADPPQPPSTLVAEVGDIIRIGRTGTTLWVRVSKNGGTSFTEIYSRLSTVNGVEAMPVLFARVGGLNFSGTLSNVRGVGWVAP